MTIALIGSLMDVQMVSAGWGWGTNAAENGSTHVPKINSDGEYITAEKAEEQLDAEIKQVCEAMESHKQKYKKVNTPVFEKKIDTYVEECANPEKPCAFDEVQRFMHQTYTLTFQEIIKKNREKLNRLHEQKQLREKEKKAYLTEKMVKNKELCSLLDGIARYVTQEERGNNVWLLEEAEKLSQQTIEPNSNCLVDLARYQDVTSKLHDQFMPTLMVGRINELQQLYPDDKEINKLHKQFEDKKLNTNTPTFYIGESLNKRYVQECEVLRDKCKKLIDTMTLDAVKEEFSRKVEERKYYAKGLIELLEQYEEQNKIAVDAQELMNNQQEII